MERLKSLITQMGEMGKGGVQVCLSEMAEEAVQRQPIAIRSLETCEPEKSIVHFSVA